ncbi:MAG: hypothetical protein ACRDH2_02035 [Anaerolineales bacterium]
MPRPTSVTLLALALFGLTAFNLLGAVSGVQRYGFLSRLPLGLLPAYLIGSSAVWAVVFGVLAAGLWGLRGWGRVGTLITFTLYVAQGWFDRLVLSRSDFAHTTIPYALLLSLIELALVWGILLRRKVRQSFR